MVREEGDNDFDYFVLLVNGFHAASNKPACTVFEFRTVNNGVMAACCVFVFIQLECIPSGLASIAFSGKSEFTHLREREREEEARKWVKSKVKGERQINDDRESD